MNRKPLKKTNGIEYMVEDGESENDPTGCSADEEKMRGYNRNPKGEKGQDATVSEYEEKRWKEDVREKTEVRAIGQ